MAYICKKYNYLILLDVNYFINYITGVHKDNIIACIIFCVATTPFILTPCRKKSWFQRSKKSFGKKAYDRILKTIPTGNPIKKGRYLYVFFYCTWGQAPIGCTNLLVLNSQIFFAAWWPFVWSWIIAHKSHTITVS